MDVAGVDPKDAGVDMLIGSSPDGYFRIKISTGTDIVGERQTAAATTASASASSTAWRARAVCRGSHHDRHRVCHSPRVPSVLERGQFGHDLVHGRLGLRSLRFISCGGTGASFSRFCSFRRFGTRRIRGRGRSGALAGPDRPAHLGRLASSDRLASLGCPCRPCRRARARGVRP